MRSFFSVVVIAICMSMVSCGAPAATKTASGAIFDISGDLLAQRADTLVDLGRLKEGEVVQYESVIRNAGTEPLVITTVRAACGCTAVEYEKQPIAPGATGGLSFRFDSRGMWGMQLKLIEVVTSAGSEPYKITVRAEVE